MANEPEVTPMRDEPPKVTVLPDEPEIPRTRLGPEAATTTAQLSVQLPSSDALTTTAKEVVDIAGPLALALLVIVATLWVKRLVSNDDGDRTDHGV